YGLSALGAGALGAGLPTPPDGTGQTIAIVDAYDDPSIYPALDAFDSQFGLTDSGPSLYRQYGPASSFLTVLNQQGQPTSLPASDPNGAGTGNWEVEEALDVEWVHAIAPGAQIILVEAGSQSLSDLMAGVATAAGQPGVSVVSMSWGFPEGQAVFSSDEATYDAVLTTPGVTFVASTGDYGAADPEYPAFSPNVVAVGGTSLSLNTDNSYSSETGWGYFSNSQGTLIGSGGGISQYEPEPAYQQGIQSTGSRTTPDVSLVADPATGAWIADPYNLPGSNPFEVVGGTSLSAPAWAGLLALVNQGRAASGEPSLNSSSPTEAQQALYSLPQSDYNVIASGTNGYSANPGYNLVTGLGTPVANRLVPDLVAYQGPATTYTGAAVGPLQDANLVNTGASAGGPINVFSVFDSLTITSNGPGYPRNQSVSSDLSSPAIVMPAAIVSNRASIALLTGAGFSSGSSPSFLSAFPDTLALSAGPSRSPSVLTPRTSTEMTVTPVSSALITKPSSPQQLDWSPAQGADRSRTDWEHPLGLQGTSWEDEPGSINATRRTGALPDRVLDDLVSDLVGSGGLEAHRAVGVPDRPVIRVIGDRAGQGGAQLSGLRLAQIPAGPMSRPERPRQSGRPAARLEDLLKVGGFCGLGAILLAARNPRAASVSSRRRFLKFKTTQGS
ncbi:MAG: S8 family serine peptidase, partial [Candidatus Limnocylindrales bacterium]